ncbi:MAG: hypothetical protein IJC25_05970 [Clostridia bacterium]|nr:hypothetical protein [Clostridia bacterium]
MFFKKRLRKATPEDDAKLAQAMEENDVGFKDRFAMVVSAFLVIVLPCLLILLAISGFALWLFT